MAAIFNKKTLAPSLAQQCYSAGLSRFFSKSSKPALGKVGIPEFLNRVGKGVETHTAKLETEIGDLEKLLVTRTFKLKKLGIPCKHRGDWDTRGFKRMGVVSLGDDMFSACCASATFHQEEADNEVHQPIQARIMESPRKKQ